MKVLRILLLALCAVGFSAAQGAESSDELIAQADRLWAEKRLDQAQKAFEAAVRAAPDVATVHFRFAGFLLARQQTTPAIGEYQKAISLDPKHTKAWIGLGLAYVHVGKHPQALAALNEAVKLEPQRREKLAPLMAKLESRAS